MGGGFPAHVRGCAHAARGAGQRVEQYAAELETTRDEYIALVGHELRTPLTCIQSYTDIMRSDPDLSAGERQEMLDVMHRRGGEPHTLIEKLLDVAGTRAGPIKLVSRRFDLTALIADAAEHARSYDPPITVDLNIPPEAMIDGDPDRLQGRPGTGLTLARAVVEQHGGTIVVSEPEEAATTFTVRLPTHRR